MQIDLHRLRTKSVGSATRSNAIFFDRRSVFSCHFLFFSVSIYLNHNR
jgi:hypothetical protein